MILLWAFNSRWWRQRVYFFARKLVEGVSLVANLSILPDPCLLELMSMEVDDALKLITATATTTASEAACPLCQHPSHRIHSHYRRTLTDLPCCGQRVKWVIQVRRFRCLNPSCKRKLFSERLPTCAPAYARRTLRLGEALSEVACTLGGKVGEGIAGLMSMTISHDTLIRLIRRRQPAATATPRVLGVDDFAWKKGRRYGTILIDLERHQVIDVLPDREAETLSAWLKEHPGVEIISRDRAGAYAEGASTGAPEAVQIADRFHLLLNVMTAATRLFERKHDTLKHVYEQEKALDPPVPPAPGDTDPAAHPLTVSQQQQQARQARRHNRYDEVKKLHEQGVSQRAIAALVGLHRDTVHRYLNTEELPAIVRPHRRSKLDAYKDSLHRRWREGERNITHLVAELREQGYRGSDTIVFDYLRPLREQPEWLYAYQQQRQRAAQGMPTAPLSAREAAWLFVCPPPKLTLAQVRQLDPLRTRDEELGKAYELVQDFRTMVTRRQLAFLPCWIEEAKASGLPELRRFAEGLLRDYDAVRAALSFEYSQGQTEGQVHRLKLIKRQGYGRASFDLLRLRVLHGSGRTYHQKCV
jgi:transposase